MKKFIYFLMKKFNYFLVKKFIFLWKSLTGRICKRGMSKVDYVEKSTNDYNFPKEKLEIKNRVKIKCATCAHESDNLNSFAVIYLFQNY